MSVCPELINIFSWWWGNSLKCHCFSELIPLIYPIKTPTTGNIWSRQVSDIESATYWDSDLANLQAKVSATVRLFGGDSSHTPFFDWQSFQGNTLYPLAIIHMEHMNVLDFDDKSERKLCFSFGNLGIIFNGASAQLFPPGRNGNSAGSEVTRRPMAAEINRCRLLSGRICEISQRSYAHNLG